MKKQTIVALMAVSFSGVAVADMNPGMPDFSPESVSVAASMGYLGGESHELVYDGGRKVSQLDWKIKNAAIIKGDISWDAYSWLTLNARGWSTLASGSGHMDDYDWLNDNQSGWTDHSSHENTNLNYANEFDLNLKGWILRGETYKVGAIAGYQQTRFSWTAFGGDYNYDNGTNVGSFTPGERGIGYQQRFSMPYIGLVGQYRYQNFEVNGAFKFSGWVKSKDNDEHYMRDLTFRDNGGHSNYYGVAMDVGYYVTPNAKVFAEFAWNKYEEGKGGTEMIDRDTGTHDYFDGDAAGLKNKNYTATVGLQYRF
ncbi:omptin family outer membrane protease [Mangrovibacter plantisponsor]|uniref:Plasminogen activator n=1 Tax=Mangrovibacter plantisponsor TaxID=451513 RepID=A0A317Q4C0_9ENTR|nr:omptin family outer membrane protease [Mangrovibacter plantisponsor]PWW11444.1 plasminogen activator [Mangrovibacter plantisponsor]